MMSPKRFVVLLLSVTLGGGQTMELRVGHVTAARDHSLYDLAWNMSIADAREMGLLSDDVQVRYFTEFGNDAHAAVKACYKLYDQDSVDVLIGPPSGAAMSPVAMFASGAWNMMTLGHQAADEALSDKRRYRTLARVSTGLETFLAATYALLRHYDWETIGVAMDSSDSISAHLASKMARLSQYGPAQRNRWCRSCNQSRVIFSPSVNITVDIHNELGLKANLESLRKASRVIFVCLGGDINSATDFMLAANDNGMTSAEYAYIMPWVERKGQMSEPWAQRIDQKDRLLEAYRQTQILMPQGLDDDSLTSFEKKLTAYAQSQTTIVQPLKALPNDLILFYDACLLLAYSVNKCLASTNGRNRCTISNGRSLNRVMRLQEFPGASGPVIMSSSMDRMVNFVVGSLDFDSKQIVPRHSIMVENVTLPNGQESYDRVVNEVSPIPWITTDGKPPEAYPKCGFVDELCPADYTAYYVVCAACVTLLITTLALAIRQYHKKTVEAGILAMSWLVDKEELVGNKTKRFSMRNLSMVSMHSESAANNVRQTIDAFGDGILAENMTEEMIAYSGIFSRTAEFKGTIVGLKRFLMPDPPPLQKNRATLIGLKEMRDLKHDNLNAFAGICLTSNTVLTVVWSYCQKGSLEDAIYNDEMNLDQTFKSSILKDIVRGIEYLHNSPVKAHGNLTVSNCVIDSRWVVKLTDFGISTILGPYRKAGQLLWKEPAHKHLYQLAPETLRALRKGEYVATPEADIYSYSMIMFQVLFNEPPFESDIIGEDEVLVSLREPIEMILRPVLPPAKKNDVHPGLLDMMKAGWEEQPEDRPKVFRLRTNTFACMSGYSHNLVDHMAGMMERYAKNLEQMVHSRTQQLQEERKRADNLLKKMLPPSVAERLKLGLAVDAEAFESVTVFFSDVVDFAKLCSHSSPAQIVTMLNQLYGILDELIASRDVYKVETIADSYLAVSGLPERNEKQHVVEIASLALAVLETVGNYRVPHLKNYTLSARIGIHTGPVAAGVVGLAMPHYCLFGNTVNVAARLEQTCLPNKIQMTEATKDYLMETAGDMFATEQRGQIEVKGKGFLNTFWLQGRTQDRIEQIV